MAPVFLGQVALNLLLQADVLLLRRLSATAAEEAGLAVTEASPLVGAYAATQLYCFLPYQLLLAITFILFPMLTEAARDGDRAKVALLTRGGVRVALILAGAMVSVTSGLSGSLLKLLFKEEFWIATNAMQVLTLGFGVFAVFGIFSAILNSLKREVLSMLITALAVVLVATLCLLRVPGTPFGTDLLMKTATSTSAGIVLATLLAGIAVKRAAGSVVNWLSVARVGIAVAVAVALGRWLPSSSKIVTILQCGLVAGTYLVVLLLSQELGTADWKALKTIVRRR